MTKTNTQYEADIASCIRPAISGLGFLVLRVRFHNGLVQVMAEASDHTQPMTVADCARISRAILPSLEASPRLGKHIRLEVTTPGVARPLFSREDYVRFTGQPVKLTTHALIKGRRRFSGRLLEVADGDTITLATDDGQIVLDYADIESGKLDGAVLVDETLKARAS